VNHCKSIFARHGVPEVVVSDNGPQFDPVKTSEFSRFAADYGFKHITSSPRYPQSNGFVEAAVKIVKLQLKKNADPYKALMETSHYNQYHHHP
jgi:transposase InsO family protein